MPKPTNTKVTGEIERHDRFESRWTDQKVDLAGGSTPTILRSAETPAFQQAVIDANKLTLEERDRVAALWLDERSFE